MNEDEIPESHWTCKSCNQTLWGVEPAGAICYKCLTDDKVGKKLKKDISILHRISSETVKELDKIALETKTKRSKLIDQAIKDFIMKHHDFSVVRTCRKCGKLFRTKSFAIGECDECSRS